MIKNGNIDHRMGFCCEKKSCKITGAGAIVKSNKKMIWGHKASILGLFRQGIALDASAVADAAAHDGVTLLPHVEMLFEKLPEVKPWINRILYDSACDDKKLRFLIKMPLC